jgi:hypothetical protein
MINIIRSQPEPSCLAYESTKKNGDYKCGDVIYRLEIDFFNKCYICEAKRPSNINVEHFKAHKGDKKLKFDWNNLNLSCGHCNNTKLAIHDNILDCTNENIKIIDLIEFKINPFPKEKAEIKALIDNQSVINTVKLLDEVYNGTTTLKQLESSNLRTQIINEMRVFSNLLFEYYEDGLTQEEKQAIKNSIKQKLSVESAFTAFKVCVIKNNVTLLKEFGDLLN